MPGDQSCFFNLPTCCQRNEDVFRSLKKLGEGSRNTGTRLPDLLNSISLSSTELGWVALSLLGIYLCAPCYNGEDTCNC